MAMLVKDILKKNIDDFLSTVYKEPKLKGSMIQHVELQRPKSTVKLVWLDEYTRERRQILLHVSKT